jgi:hypothetical protein
MRIASVFDMRPSMGFRRLAVAMLAVLAFAMQPAFAADRVVGANATLDIEPGARSAALGSATMAVDGDYLGLVSNPHQLSSARYLWASFLHTAYYEDTRYDYASAVIPLSEGQGLGVSFARFGADDIPYIREGDPLPEGGDYNTLSIADWIVSATWGRRLFDRLDLGVGFHLLYRDMDQTGWGFRGDASLRYRVVDELYVSGLLRGWTSSATTWESGEFEYSAPEFYLAASYSLPVAYLYGKLNLYWQGAGLFHHEARALDFETDEDVGGRIWDSPLDWLSGGRGGIEFAFDFGLSVRAGLSSFTTFKSVTAGAGLTIAKFLRVDYAFESHPVLSPVHRVSVSISPYLFAHAPKPEPEAARRGGAGSSLLGAEPDEPEEVPDSAASGDALEGASSSATQDARQDAGQSAAQPAGPAPEAPAPQAPVVQESSGESSDEVLEPAPSGGMYWEE